MRPVAALLVLAAGLAMAGCGSPCQDLGDRLCQCSGTGTAATNCKTAIKNELKAAGISSTDSAACSAALATCGAPSGADFCEWINTSCGKASCGLSNETAATVCQ